MSLKQLIDEYLRAYPLMTVASSRASRPWACTVYYSFDSDFNIYFISRTFRRHSLEIRENSRVAAAICRPHLEPFENPPCGLQLEGNCDAIEEIEEASEILGNYIERFPASTNLHGLVEDVTGSIDRRIYRIKPERIVLFDEDKFPKQPQQEYLL